MKRHFPKLLTALLLFFCATIQALPRAPVHRPVGGPLMRILLTHKVDALRVVALSGQVLFATPDGSALRQLGKEAKIQSTKETGRVRVNGVVVPTPFYLRGFTDDARLRLQSGVYTGWIQITNEGKTLTAINWLPLENYLLGTVASEMAPSWEIEALKAQAVAARSYALFMHQHPKTSLYDLESDVHDQVYNAAGEPSPRVAEAVLATRGEILLDGKLPMRAHYHSRCGGITDSPGAVWSREGSSGASGVRCPYCKAHPYYWKAVIAISDFLKDLNLPGVLDHFRLASLPRAPSGRVRALTVVTRDAKETISGNELRNRLGYARIKSTLFSWKVDKDTIEFKGTGLGHGVGMCQWGAREMARRGNNYREILGYFYPGVALERQS